MHPTLKARITKQLIENMPSYSKALSRTAKYILDHPAEFGVHSIRESATRIGVSTNTLVRLSGLLGFDSFDELRAPFRDALLVSEVAARDESWLDRLSEADGLARIQASASASAIGNVTKSLRDLDRETLQRVAKRFFAANGVFVLGVRASFSLAYYFHYIGRMALPSIQLIPRSLSPAIDDLAFASEGDVMFGITVYPYSSETIRTCQFAQKKGMDLVLLSDSLISVPDLEPDEVLVSSTVSSYHFTSYVGMLAILESLLAIMVEQGGDGARRRIAAYEDLRDQTDAYWRLTKKNKRSY